MRFLKTKSDNTKLLINEHETTTSSKSSLPNKDHHSSIQCHGLQQDYMTDLKDNSSPSSQYFYTEIVKSIGNDKFLEEKRLLKRASWSPAALQDHGLPPSGKRIDNEPLITSRTSNRVRLRPKVSRFFQPQQNINHCHMFTGRPVSFNERYDYHSIDNQQRKFLNSSIVSLFVLILSIKEHK